jgi:hypothetical protein
VNFRNIRPAFTTTVYAFLNPKLPSAAWDFFLPAIWQSLRCPETSRAAPHFFNYY